MGTVTKNVTALIHITVVLTLIGLTQQSLKAEVTVGLAPVDVVWSQSDNGALEVFYASSNNGVWTDPMKITDDQSDNLFPVIDRDLNGQKWIFWSAYYNGRSVIRYTSGQADQWLETGEIDSGNQTNVSPSVVIDGSNAIWLVWSANNGLTDDVYFAVNRDGSWTAPEPVHPANERPDVLPVVDLDGSGAPTITWQAMIDGTYQQLVSTWDGTAWTPEATAEVTVQQETAPAGQDGITLPPFLDNKGMVFVRFY